MSDTYFTKFDQMISPIKHVAQIKKLRQKTPKLTQSKSSQNYQVTVDDINMYRQLLMDEKKNNMYLRHDNNCLKKQVNELSQRVDKLNEIILKNKITNEQNCDYILKLEGLIGRLRDENFGKKKDLYEKHKKMKSEEMLNSNNISSNSKSPNKSPNKSGIASNKSFNKFSKKESKEISKIEDFPYSGDSFLYDSEEIKRLKEEINHLRSFRDKVYKLSKEHDQLNENIYTFIINIQKYFEKLNNGYYSKINNDDALLLDYNTEFELYDKTHGDIEEIFNEMQKIFKIKQDEYNLIVNEKDSQITDGEKTIKGLDDKLKEEMDKNFKLLVQVEDLKNEVFILKDMRAENTKAKFAKENKAKQNLYKKNMDGNVGRDTNYQMARAKKSLDRSIGKIERVFNDNDPIKAELLDKMKSYK